MDFAAVLAQAPMFGALAAAELERLAALAEKNYLAFGQCLYREGDASDHFYFVVSGRLRISSRDKLLGYINRLEPAGEVGIITGEPRSVTIHALRDSVLLRIPREPLVALLNSAAPTLMAVTRMSLARARTSPMEQHHGGSGTLALIPAMSSMPVMVLAEKLTRQLAGWPQSRLITAAHVDAALGAGAAQTRFDDETGNLRLIDWLNEMERRHSHVLYIANSGEDTWAQRCLHQADRVLVLAEANMPPRPLPVLNDLPPGSLLAPVELVLLRPEGDPSPHTHAWREQTGARAHFFVHPWEDADVAALTRQVTGHGVGLVLGGGGARGFAHIGLIRALRELHIPVDVAGGTSMGAFIAALLACGFDPVEMAQIARETFVNNNFLNDYTLPRVSLIRGRKFLARLRQIFGERQIEELRRSYFCISTNLTTGDPVVHDRGPLATW
ncbi:MAG: patatin-like phospholipase family protein, partial [Stenotrophobium sp.]